MINSSRLAIRSSPLFLDSAERYSRYPVKESSLRIPCSTDPSRRDGEIVDQPCKILECSPRLVAQGWKS